jgi:hypothetical protein
LRDCQFGRRPANQHRDGVLILGALHADIDGLRLRAEDLAFGRRDVGLRNGIAGLELITNDLQCLLVFLDRTQQQRLQRIGGAQIEIGGSKLRLGGELHIVEIGGADLRRGSIALDLPPHLAPDVEIPRAGNAGNEGRRRSPRLPYKGGSRSCTPRAARRRSNM